MSATVCGVQRGLATASLDDGQKRKRLSRRRTPSAAHLPYWRARWSHSHSASQNVEWLRAALGGGLFERASLDSSSLGRFRFSSELSDLPIYRHPAEMSAETGVSFPQNPQKPFCVLLKLERLRANSNHIFRALVIGRLVTSHSQRSIVPKE